MTSEIWKPIPGFEVYDVSDLGRVRTWSLKNRPGGRALNPRMMSLGLNPQGYLGVTLWKNGQPFVRRVHRLVLETFVRLRRDGEECAHHNGIRTDNRLCNLRWATKVENMNDQRRHGTLVRGARCGAAKLTDQQVIQIRADPRSAPVIAAELGVNRNTIYDIRKGKQWGWLQPAAARALGIESNKTVADQP